MPPSHHRLLTSYTVLLAGVFLLGLLTHQLRAALASLDIKKREGWPEVAYPANILAWGRRAILTASLGVAVRRGHFFIGTRCRPQQLPGNCLLYTSAAAAE